MLRARHIYIAYGAGQPRSCGELRDKRGVCIGIRAAQLVVHVTDMEMPPVQRRKPVQGIEQGDGVRPAGYRCQDSAARRQQVTGCNGFSN